MKLNEKEIENISKLKPFKRYKYFIKKIADFEEFWTIVDEKGDIVLSKIDENTLVSFWVAEDFIKSNLSNNWRDCVPFKISLDNFEDTFASIIADNNYLINVFPVSDKSGFVVNLNEFTRDLNDELKQYE